MEEPKYCVAFTADDRFCSLCNQGKGCVELSKNYKSKINTTMITKTQYEKLKARHDEGCKHNDYSKMIMAGDDNWKKINEYEQEKVCKHNSIEELQGGQIERCRNCGKTWG